MGYFLAAFFFVLFLVVRGLFYVSLPLTRLDINTPSLVLLFLSFSLAEKAEECWNG